MLQGVIIDRKSLHPHDQTVLMNPIGTLALVTLFKPIVVHSENHICDENHVLKKTDVVGIIDIGNSDPVTRVFTNSILQQVIKQVVKDDNNQVTIDHPEDISNVSFLPLKNTNRLRQTMTI